MKKSIMLLTVFPLVAPMYSTATPSASINLDASILKIIDGMSIGMSGHRIGKTRRLAKQLVDFYRETGTIIKTFIEAGLDPESTDAEVQNELAIFKNKLHEITVPFMADMDGFRAIVLDLIKDSCEKRKNPHSFLLTWGKCPEGKEYESIKNNLKTFSELKTFTSDLILFLGDLIHSCPKGCAQYAELIRQQQEKNQ